MVALPPIMASPSLCIPMRVNLTLTEQSHWIHIPVLAVTLDRLGHDGNGSCLNHMIPTWGVSNGSLCNFTSHCFTTMEDCLQAYLKWPDREEQARISGEFASRGFPGCVGLIDGTLIQLSQRPKDSGECYYDQKNRDSMNAQVVCDHRCKISYLYTGLPGFVADLTCLKRSKLWRKYMEDSRALFNDGQYLLGDSGYYNNDHFISAFAKWESSTKRAEFNTCVAKARVTNEHCIGVLKSRWFSLKEMSTQLKSKAEHTWFVRWVGICARLHNFVMSRNDLWSEEDSKILANDSEPAIREPSLTDWPMSRRDEGNALLQQVMAIARAFHKQPGGCSSLDGHYN